MNEPARTVGVLSFVAPWRRLRSGDDRALLLREAGLLAAIREAGFEVMPGGAMGTEEERLASGAAQLRRQIQILIEMAPAAIVFDLTGGALAADVAAAAGYLARDLPHPPRLALCADVAHEPSAIGAAIAAAGALRRARVPCPLHLGDPRDPVVRRALAEDLGFFFRRHAAAARAKEAQARLRKQKIVAFGPAGHRDGAETVSEDALLRAFGVALEGCRFDRLEALAAVIGGGDADARLARALRALAPRLRPRADAEAAAILRRQLARYFAAQDLVREREGTAAVFQDGDAEGRPGSDAWLALAFLNQAEGPAGEPKDVVPAAPRGDVLTALALIAGALLVEQPGAAAVVGEAREDVVRFRGEAPWPPLLLDDDYGIDALSGELLSRVAPRHELTVARYEEAAPGRFLLHVVEGVTAGEQPPRGSLLDARLPLPAWPLLASLPSSRVALLPGRQGGALVELAHRMDQGFRVVTLEGRTLERPA